MPRGLSAPDLAKILEVTRALAAPFDLLAMLTTVTAAARQVLQAERASVWLHDAAADELVLEVATDVGRVRIPVGSGLVGTCARERQVINVPDCYADPRFDPSVDKRTGYRTRCSLTLPLIDYKDQLVGVMQVLNRTGGVFDATDEQLATALAAQCAVALQRVRMTDALLEGERMRKELELARAVQMSSLPAVMPAVPGYDAYGMSRPATETGGDTFDLAQLGNGMLIVLGDATGHGIAPALSVTQMHAMLRMALRLRTDLETAYLELNNLLSETLAEDRFITAFIGVGSVYEPAEKTGLAGLTGAVMRSGGTASQTPEKMNDGSDDARARGDRVPRRRRTGRPTTADASRSRGDEDRRRGHLRPPRAGGRA